MNVVETLDELIRSNLQEMIKSHTVNRYEDKLVFSYKIGRNMDKFKVFGLNPYLKYKIYPATKETGKVSFEVIKSEIEGNNLSVIVKYVYLPVLYLDIIPKEINVIIISKINNTLDIQNLCKADNLCDELLTKELFRIRFPQLYATYIKYGLTLNMASYLAFVQFQEDDSSPLLHRDFLDFFAIRKYSMDKQFGGLPRTGMSTENQDEMAKVIFAIKYPHLIKITESNDVLRTDYHLMSGILGIGVDFPPDKDDVITLIINNCKIELKIRSIKRAIEYLGHGNQPLLYLYLLMIDYAGVNPEDQNIIDTTFIILNDIDKDVEQPKLVAYVNKIKSENIVLYNKIIDICKARPDIHKYLCQKLSK